MIITPEALLLGAARGDQMDYDVTALGELLIDFTTSGISPQGNLLLEANPGGAPCNVLSMLQRLGKKTAFIGKVGDDGFGKILKKAIAEQGIATEGLVMDKDVHTTLAIVTKTETGDRDFAFYRKPGADMMLRASEVRTDLIEHSRLFHFGTLSFTDETVREASMKAVETAVETARIISFDPNLREPLWSSMEEAHKWVAYGLSKCDVLKISDNEILWFTGKKGYDEALAKLRADYPNIKLICLSMGSDGSRAVWKNCDVTVPAFLQTGEIETTGCGDTFMGCVLNAVLETGLDCFNETKLISMLQFANGAASLVSKRKGALRVMPAKEEVLALLKERL